MAGKTVRLQFVHGSNFPSRLIEWKDDSPVSHVNIVMEDGQLLGALMEGGIKPRPANYETWPLQIIVTIPVTDEQHGEFWKYANSCIGEKYDGLGIIGIALGVGGLHEPGEMFCSEFGAAALSQDNANVIRLVRPANTIDPEKLLLLAGAAPGAQVSIIKQ